jgi:hypothetical protein
MVGQLPKKQPTLLVGEMGEAAIYLQHSGLVYQTKIFKNFFNLSK